MHHQPRVETAESSGLIRLALHHSADGQFTLAQAHTVADLGLEQQCQAGGQPHFARRRAVSHHLDTLPLVDMYPAIERVAIIHHLETGGLEGVSQADHGDHVHLIAEHQARLLQGGAQLGIEGTPLLQHQVTAQQLARLTGQAAVQPVEEEADHGGGGNRQGQGDEQRTHVRGTQVADESPGRETCQAQNGETHAPTSSSAISSRRP